MWPNAAGAVDEEDQIHWARLTLLLWTLETTRKHENVFVCLFLFFWHLT